MSPLHLASAVDRNLQSTAMVMGHHTNVNGMKKEMPSAQSLSNIYDYDYYSLASSDNGMYVGTASMQVVIDGTDVTLYGIYYDYPIKGTFDPATGTITVPKQDIVMNTYYNEMMRLYIEDNYDEEGEYLGQSVFKDFATLSYYPNGAQLNDGSIVCVGGWISDGFEQFTVSIDSVVSEGSGWMWHLWNRIRPMEEIYPDAPMFRYDEDLWKDAGTAELTERWFSPGFVTDLPAYTVPVKRNINNPNEILLVNPYGEGTPLAEYNTAADKSGFIYLNIENPECVLVRPMTVCGFENNEYLAECSLGCTSWEGVCVYMENYEYDDVLEEAAYWDDPVAKMVGNTVTLPNCKFQVGYSMQQTDSWQDRDGNPIPMNSKIEFFFTDEEEPSHPGAPLYIVGQGDGIDWDPYTPAELTYNNDANTYTIEVANMSMFKLSTAYGDWEIFNENALGCPNYGDTPGVTVALEPWGENTYCPWMGDYTIEVAGDLSTLTLYTNTPQPAEKIYLRGDMNGWGAEDAWSFSKVDGTTDIYEFTCAADQLILASEGFKIADAGWAKVNYGVEVAGDVLFLDSESTLVYNGANILLDADWDGVCFFQLSSGKIFMSNDKNAANPFGEVEEEVCANPVISIVDNRLVVTCATPDAVITTSIVAEDQQTVTGTGDLSIDLSGVYKVTAYATREGLKPSNEMRATLVWTNVEEIESDVDPIPMNKERAVLIRTVGENIELVGTTAGESVELFSVAGAKIYAGKANEGVTCIPVSLQNGKVYIVTIGKQSVKYRL